MVSPSIQLLLSSGLGAGNVSELVRRTGIVRRCEECIITRKMGDLGGIFADFEIGLRGYGLVCSLVV